MSLHDDHDDNDDASSTTPRHYDHHPSSIAHSSRMVRAATNTASQKAPAMTRFDTWLPAVLILDCRVSTRALPPARAPTAAIKPTATSSRLLVLSSMGACVECGCGCAWMGDKRREAGAEHVQYVGRKPLSITHMHTAYSCVSSPRVSTLSAAVGTILASASPLHPSHPCVSLITPSLPSMCVSIYPSIHPSFIPILVPPGSCP